MSKFSIEGEYHDGLAIGVTQGFFRGIHKGLVNENQEFILSADYDDILKFESGWKIKKGSDWGLCNPEGRIVVKPKYSQIDMLPNGVLMMRRNDSCGLYDSKGKNLIPSSYDSVSLYEEGGYIVSKDKKSGFYDSSFHLSLKPKYSSLRKFSNGYLLVTEGEGENTLYGIADIKGKFILPIKYRAIEQLHDGMSIIQKGSHFGFINATAEVVVPIQYDSVDNFKDGFTIALERRIFKKDKRYAINKEGKIIISSEKYEIDRCPFGILIKERKKFGLANNNGDIIIPPISDKYIFRKNLIISEAGNSRTIYNSDGQPLDYTIKLALSDNSLILQMNEKFGLMNSEDDIALDFIYDDIRIFDDTLLEVIEDGKKGLSKNNGCVILPPIFEKIERFGEDRFLVSSGVKKGIYDDCGKLLLPVEYDEIETFCESTLLIRKDGKFGLFDINGKRLLATDFDKIQLNSDGCILLFNQDKLGMFSLPGNLIPTEFERIENDRHNYVVTKNGLKGLISPKCTMLLSPEYDNIELKKGYYFLQKNSKTGIATLLGETIVPFFDEVKQYFGNLFVVKNGDKYGVFNNLGDTIFDTVLNKISLVIDNYLLIESNFHKGLINKRGKIIVEPTSFGFYFYRNKKTRIFKNEYPTLKSVEGTSILLAVIPNGVKEIANDAFYGCEELTEVIIPDGVSEIGSSTFKACSSLKKIEIPSSVTKIGEDAFHGCEELTEVIIPDGVSEIGSWAFYYCSSLKKVEIPSSVTKIEEGAFERCKELTEVIIPDGVSEIGSWAFEDCSSLKKIEIPSSVTKIGEGAFCGCKELTKVIIPDGISEIGSSTFEDCSSLKKIEIPSSVTKIGEGAFYGCKELTKVIKRQIKQIGGYFAFIQSPRNHILITVK